MEDAIAQMNEYDKTNQKVAQKSLNIAQNLEATFVVYANKIIIYLQTFCNNF